MVEIWGSFFYVLLAVGCSLKFASPLVSPYRGRPFGASVAVSTGSTSAPDGLVSQAWIMGAKHVAFANVCMDVFYDGTTHLTKISRKKPLYLLNHCNILQSYHISTRFCWKARAAFWFLSCPSEVNQDWTYRRFSKSCLAFAQKWFGSHWLP